MLKKLLFTLTFLSITSFSEEKTKVFQNGLDGYWECKDATIAYQLADFLASDDVALNHEGEDNLFVYSSTCWPDTDHYTRLVIRFDLSLLNGQEIISAKLGLNVFESPGLPPQLPCTLFTLTQEFNVDEVTWDFAKKDVEWEADDNIFAKKLGENKFFLKGGKYDTGNPISNEGAKTGEWESYDVTSYVKDHIHDNKENYGFIIKSHFDKKQKKRYYSSEYEDVALRPKLEVVYKENTAIVNNAKILNNMKIQQNDEFLYVIPNENNHGEVSIYSTNGKLFARKNISSEKKAAFNLNDISTGMFIIKAKINGSIYTHKLVKQ